MRVRRTLVHTCCDLSHIRPIFKLRKGHCGNYTFAFTDEVDANARFDREDPCRAVGQVQRAVEKWGLIYNRNCKKEGKEKEFAFHNRMTRKLKGLKLNVKDRMDCE